MAQHLAYLTGTPMLQAIGDLTVIALYSLLRRGELKKTWKIKWNGKLVRSTRTQQFRVQEMGFWKNGKVLSRHEALKNCLGRTQKH